MASLCRANSSHVERNMTMMRAKISCTWCKSNCGGWLRSRRTALEQWIQSLFGFILSRGGVFSKCKSIFTASSTNQRLSLNTHKTDSLTGCRLKMPHSIHGSFHSWFMWITNPSILDILLQFNLWRHSSIIMHHVAYGSFHGSLPIQVFFPFSSILNLMSWNISQSSSDLKNCLLSHFLISAWSSTMQYLQLAFSQ
jgi:hypothetical protein